MPDIAPAEQAKALRRLAMIMVLTALVFRGSAFWVYYESQRPRERRRRVHVS